MKVMIYYDDIKTNMYAHNVFYFSDLSHSVNSIVSEPFVPLRPFTAFYELEIVQTGNRAHQSHRGNIC